MQNIVYLALNCYNKTIPGAYGVNQLDAQDMPRLHLEMLRSDTAVAFQQQTFLRGGA